MNGIGLAQAIRERWPGVGLVFTSGQLRPALPTGVAFLAKLYLLDTVITVIRQIAMQQMLRGCTECRANPIMRRSFIRPDRP
ncbi:hypothetical protein ILT44_26710 [Microvirga sp. BT689]|uniref:hypothetical protein n=1 Tax=Microvirga arvi TaxID=2778731 RepID=UPI001951DA0A|nr:hypothetical protein [Microvirga arvi]MBM6583798.1 hypothetical protein [Microvirga arvi]